MSYFETGQCPAERHSGPEHCYWLIFMQVLINSTRSIQAEDDKVARSLNIGSWSSRWQVSCAEKSLLPTLLTRSFCTVFRYDFLPLDSVAKISFSGRERGSLFVAYFARYSMTLQHDTQYCMSKLPRHADSWMGLKLLIRPSFRA